jgi:hypothetical protein
MVPIFRMADSDSNPQTGYSADKERDELLTEFQTLGMLLALVSSLNNQCHTTFNLHTQGGNEEKYRRLPDIDRRSSAALDAIVALLVRDTEVVAASMRQLPTTAVNLLSVEDDPDDLTSDQNQEFEVSIGSITTFANPDHRDSSRYKGKLRLAGPGTSHWQDICTLRPVDIPKSIE